MSSSKTVLILSYYWPPAGGSGVQRWMYFAKYLKKFGWRPIVLTVDEKYASYPILDRTLESEVQNIEVYKTRTREPLRWYSRFVSGSSTQGIPRGEVSKKGLFSKILAFIRGNFFIPDARKGWNAYAAVKAFELIKEKKISTLITTGPPHSTHLVGLFLKRSLKIRWLADFRDPWTDIFYNKDLYRTYYAKKSDARWEKQVLETADAVLTTVGGKLHKTLKEKAVRQNYVAIPNGYDAQLLQEITRTPIDDFHIVYTGLLTRHQNYATLLSAIAQFKEATPKVAIRFSLAGQINHSIIDQIINTLPGIQVDYHGYLSHRDAVALMKSADLLVNFLFEGAEQQMISGKLLEYLATGIPVLSLGDPDSEAGHLVNKGSHSRMFYAGEEKPIFEFISWIAKQKEPVENTHPQLGSWSREALAKRLSDLLETV